MLARHHHFTPQPPTLPPASHPPPLTPPPLLPPQGGEFAFVLLALANQLNVLPAELNRLLIIVVVLSMALTPLLTEVGKTFAAKLTAPGGEGEHAGRVRPPARSQLERAAPPRAAPRAQAPCCCLRLTRVPVLAPRVAPRAPPAALYSSEGYNQEEPVVICGFGGVGQTVANMLESPALGRPLPYVAFDNNVGRVQAAQEAGFNVLFGDGTRKKVGEGWGGGRAHACGVVWCGARWRAATGPARRGACICGQPVLALANCATAWLCAASHAAEPRLNAWPRRIVRRRCCTRRASTSLARSLWATRLGRKRCQLWRRCGRRTLGCPSMCARWTWRTRPPSRKQASAAARRGARVCALAGWVWRAGRCPCVWARVAAPAGAAAPPCPSLPHPAPHPTRCLPAGATDVVIAEAEAGLVVGSQLARGLGVPDRAIKGLAGVLRAEMGSFAAELAVRAAGEGKDSSEAASVFRFDQAKSPAFTDDPISRDEPLPGGWAERPRQGWLCGCVSV